MIGVAAHPRQMPWVTEFFELFKTPWEPMVTGKRYEAVLIADGCTEPVHADVAVIYGAEPHPCDARIGTLPHASGDRQMRWQQFLIPVYGRVAALAAPSGTAAPLPGHGYAARVGQTRVRRLAYDLFDEVAMLLTAGQPVTHAETPTLELHIALLRECLEAEQVAFVEIPPRPAGHEFVCCLTHDIDFFGIRRHAADRTLAGFISRGTVGTTLDVVRGRRTIGELAGNLAAVATLPLVFTGVARDFWHPFDDYAVADRGHAATYFLVPFKEQPGVSPEGVVEPARAVAYDAREIAEEVHRAAKPHVEFAVHGLDAWRNADAGRAELALVASVSGRPDTGVRMHWLYYDENTPLQLEAAGFKYDSTWGYNEAVGFRAGTMQAFKLPGTRRLLELPLTIMDTAMLYPGRMALTRDEAGARASAVVDQARTFGGALVVNWHDRSLAPERQWGACYNQLLDEIEQHNPWFATASEAADWFGWRRSIRFERSADTGAVTVSAPPNPGLPPARLTLRRGGVVHETTFCGGAERVA